MRQISAGIDGCRGGWIMVYHDGKEWGYRFEQRLVEILDDLPVNSHVLIDIPLGLSTPGFPRTVEKTLRQRVPGKASTVFNVPCRAAIYEEDPEVARRLNIQETGKSLSEQSLNIRYKIREADIWLRDSWAFEGPRLNESHPETAFAALNGGVILKSKKSQTEGREERLTLLKTADKELIRLYERVLKETRRKDIKPDDILDAAALCLITCRGREKGLDFIQDENRIDQFGIEMKIACLKSGDQ